MRNARQQLGLAAKPRSTRIGILAGWDRHDLDADEAVECVLPRQVDLSHSSFIEHLEDLVPLDHRGGRSGGSMYGRHGMPPVVMSSWHRRPDDAMRTTSRQRDSKWMDVVEGLSLVHCIMTEVPVGTQDRDDPASARRIGLIATDRIDSQTYANGTDVSQRTRLHFR